MIYSANYRGYEPNRTQPVPIQMYTEADHPVSLTVGYPVAQGRLEAKWWKVRPDLACPDASVTIWLDGSMTLLRDDFEVLALAELEDDDALFMRHPWRDCIYDERDASHPNAKYDGQWTAEQVASYREAGHPEHWGLVHSGLIVRRNNPRVLAFDQTWWDEITRWSIQDQLSLPPLLRTMDLRWHYWPIDPITAGDVRWGAFNA
jgi:hypothetical protein